MEEFELIYTEQYSRIYKVVYLLSGDRELSADAVQQAFVKAILNIDQLKDKSKITSWITKIAANEAKSILAERKRYIECSNLVMDKLSSLSVSHFLDDIERKDEILVMLNKLNYREKRILMLRYYLDFSNEEISEYLGISVNSVKLRLLRAKKSLEKSTKKINNVDYETFSISC